MSNSRHSQLLLIIAILAVALNLRPAIASIGPLLDMIELETGLSHTQSSLLTSIPVFMMGACALLARNFAYRMNERIGISLGVMLIFIACWLRYWQTEKHGLLLTATLIGIGIALAQNLMPAFIKRHFSMNTGRVFALYTTGIMAGAAISASTAAGLSKYWGWPMALSIWCIPALVTLIIWARASKAKVQPAHNASSYISPRRQSFRLNRRAWELMIFFGIGTGAYTLVLAWLPPFYTSLGWQPSTAGFMLGGLTLTEVLAGLAVSVWIGKFNDRRQPLLAMLIILIAGLACLIFAPLSLALPASLLLGISIGALFPLSLILTLDHIEDPTEAGMLAAFVQGGGYIIASAMPLLAGMLRDQFSNLTHAWIAMTIGAVLLVLLCLRFSPSSYRQIYNS